MKSRTGSKSSKINLIRKPHFGIQVSGAEHDCQQALAEVLWSETPFSGDPVTEITHAEGLVFNLRGDAALLPLVEYANQLLSNIRMRRTIGLVAKSEEQLGGRFTDDAVLHLALVFAILANRVQGGHHLEIDEQLLNWLQAAKIWPVASYVARHLGRDYEFDLEAGRCGRDCHGNDGCSAQRDFAGRTGTQW